jgi:hypothetical protein
MQSNVFCLLSLGVQKTLWNKCAGVSFMKVIFIKLCLYYSVVNIKSMYICTCKKMNIKVCYISVLLLLQGKNILEVVISWCFENVMWLTASWICDLSSVLVFRHHCIYFRLYCNETLMMRFKVSFYNFNKSELIFYSIDNPNVGSVP